MIERAAKPSSYRRMTFGTYISPIPFEISVWLRYGYLFFSITSRSYVYNYFSLRKGREASLPLSYLYASLSELIYINENDMGRPLYSIG